MCEHILPKSANSKKDIDKSALFAYCKIKSANNARAYIGGAKMRSLKKMRKDQKLTQQQVADMIGISLRSYISYENDLEKVGTVKYNYMVDFLSKMNNIDEEHGILELDDIRNRCSEVFAQYDVSYCYLFGSYAKSKAKPTSDIDLLISANIKGLEFFGLLEELRESLQKKIDVLDINQLKGNFGLVEEILKDGIKIYG